MPLTEFFAQVRLTADVTATASASVLIGSRSEVVEWAKATTTKDKLPVVVIRLDKDDTASVVQQLIAVAAESLPSFRDREAQLARIDKEIEQLVKQG